MAEPISTGVAVGVVIALVEVIKAMVEKWAPKQTDPAQTKIAEALASLAQSQERVCETLDRLEAKLEKTADAVAETKYRLVGSRTNGA